MIKNKGCKPFIIAHQCNDFAFVGGNLLTVFVFFQAACG